MPVDSQSNHQSNHETRVVNLSTLEQLLHGLARLKESDGHARLTNGEFWCKPAMLPIELEEGASAVTRNRSTLQGLKAARDALRSMICSLDGEIESQSTNSYLMHLENGLATVPDDILAMILELSAANVEEAENLRRVCSRFRRIVESLPRLWNIVASDFGETQLDRALQLSRVQPLFVTIDDDDDGGERALGNNLEQLVRHSARWRAVEIHGFGLAWEELPRHCTNLKLQQMQKLSVALHDHALYNARNIDKSSLYTFFSTWEAPRLQVLRTRNILPYHVKGAVLTSCTIELDSYVEWVTFPHILSFLMSCPSLKTLFLASSQASIMNIPPNIPELQNEPVVVLQSLELFSLMLDTNFDPQESDDEDLLSSSSIRRFLDSLIAPNLVTLEVALKTQVPRLLESLLGIVFFDNRYPTASNVKVALSRTKSYTPLVWIPLFGRPHLADLTLEIPDMYIPDCHVPDSDGYSEFAHLTTLTFRRCYYARGKILAHIIGDIWEYKGISLRNKCLPLKVVFEDCPFAERMDWLFYREHGIDIEVRGMSAKIE